MFGVSGVTDAAKTAADSAGHSVRISRSYRDRQTGDSRGFGFVEMEKDQEAAAAISGLDQTELDGRTVTVSEARPRTGGPGRPGGGGGRRDFGRRGGRGR